MKELNSKTNKDFIDIVSLIGNVNKITQKRRRRKLFKSKFLGVDETDGN
jgi:hypothetical protein